MKLITINIILFITYKNLIYNVIIHVTYNESLCQILEWCSLLEAKACNDALILPNFLSNHNLRYTFSEDDIHYLSIKIIR